MFVVKAKWVYASFVEIVEKKGGYGGTPTRSIVFSIWGLEEHEGDEGWGPYKVQSLEAIVKKGFDLMRPLLCL